MEEIIKKDIFDDKDLAKLSPDYTSTSILLRMQMRSNMVKDTHSHPKIKKDSGQRKVMKRPNDSYRVGKEIVKIRNGFQNINLKNQIILKNAVKCVDRLKSEHFINGFNDEIDTLTLRAEEVNYLQDISEMNLALQNDRKFKISDKPIKDIKQNKRNEHTKKSLIENNNDTKPDHDDGIALKDILRIECTMVKQTSLPLDPVKENNIANDPHVTVDNKESDKTVTQKGINEEVTDLQSLLTMLAKSPHTDEVECHSTNDLNSDRRNLNNDSVEETTKACVGIQDRDDKILQLCDTYNFLYIVPMIIDINDQQKILLKKYADKWKAYVSKRKKLLAQQRENTLNSFFDKLSKRKTSVSDSPVTPVNKAKLLARDYNRYRHRYQMQKHIIALQKAKLEEQNRMIEELKYNRIVEASKMSVDALRDEVRKTYYDMDKQLKPKIKCLTSELKLDIEEPSLILHCLKVPQFLQRMEKRAREREEKHAMIRERRLQMEEERVRLKQQEELTKVQMDNDEKIKRMKELKDKRKREKIDNIRKKQHTERMRALNIMAELHYEKSLKAKYGTRPFKILLEINKDNFGKSKAHYKFQLLKNVFLNWMWYTEDMWYERNFKAEDFYRKKLLRRAFDGLKQNHHIFVLKKQVAEDYYDLYVTKLMFRKFLVAIAVVKKENEMKLQMSATYYNSNLLFRVFCCWRTLPALNALKREQEARKARWREKVLQVVPDYTPPED